MSSRGEVRDKGTQRAVDVLVSKLRRRQTIGSREAAMDTVLVLRQVVATARFSSIEQLLDLVRGVGKRLVEAQPRESCVGNIVRRVLKVIREEAAGVVEQSGSGSSTPNTQFRSLFRQSSPTPTQNSEFLLVPHTPSIANIVLQGHKRPTAMTDGYSTPSVSGRATPTNFEHDEEDTAKKIFAMKPALLDAIQEVINELETVYENVAKNAREYIHSEDIVLTIGKSKTVEAFLKSAARDRRFSVIVAETAPSYSGRQMATSLASANIPTVLVPDAALFALMSRVNKVVIGAHSVQATGGLFAISGSLLAAMAARAHSTPVIVCTAQFKLTPSWNAHYQYAAVDCGDPGSVLADGGKEGGEVEVINPWFDYIGPELVDVLITNYGDHPPAYVYRLVKEAYDEEDLEL